MDFENSNRLNVLVNALSGNLLPVRSEKEILSIGWRIYKVFGWSIDIFYFCTCVTGMFYVSREKALQDGTVNIIIGTEILIISIHMHRQRDALRRLIGKLNDLLKREKDSHLTRVVEEITKPLEKLLSIYVLASVISVMLWPATPLIKLFQQERFTYEDYKMPIAIGKEPISMPVFIFGVATEVVGGVYAISKKIGLDIYMIHMILLLCAQYEYLKYGFATALAHQADGISTVDRFGQLIRHHGVVVRIAASLKRVLSLNIGLLYINNVFRFCFLGLMIVTHPIMKFDQLLVMMYAVGALTQVFIICHCIQRLLDASRKFADDAFHERWYAHDVSLRRSLTAIIAANKLECRLSAAGTTVDLTLPSFMSILNQAYSVCLLFLKMK